MKERVLSIIAIISIILNGTCVTFASTLNTDDEILSSQSVDYAELFSQMTNEELNEYIDFVYQQYSSGENIEALASENASTTSSSAAYSSLQLAWLAAAQIARNDGYTCAAKLVECSIDNTSYKETETVSSGKGLFGAKIINTSAYKNYIKKSTADRPTSITFTKSMNEDLYYSLHKVNISTTGLLNEIVVITDTFDFDIDSNYDDLFTTLVNNGAWLCQNTGCLHKISVKISFFS